MNDVRKVYVYQDRCPEGTAKLAAALAKAIPNMQPLVRNCVSHFAKKGPDGKAAPDYADLAACHKSAARALADQGLVVIQTVVMTGEAETALNTQMLHSSGEWVSSVMPIKASTSDPQKYAAAITYARRTAYCAIVGLAADDDDDGAQAQSAAARSAVEEEARIERLLTKALEEAQSPAKRDEVIARAEKGVKAQQLPLDALQRLKDRRDAANKKDAEVAA